MKQIWSDQLSGRIYYKLYICPIIFCIYDSQSALHDHTFIITIIGAGLHSTRTSDGLPTLKVQSINQKLLEGRGSAQRRRSKTLPPLKISTRYVYVLQVV